LTITPAVTALSVSPSAPSAPVGTSVTFTATVTSPVGITPQGNVTFSDSGTSLGSATLDASGAAALAVATLAVGNHTIVAAYQGASNFAASSGSTPESITAASGSTGSFVIAASPDHQEVKGGGQVSFGVTLTSQAGFAGLVTLTCSGLPQDAPCSFAQPVVTLSANGSVQTTMTVGTTAIDAVERNGRGGRRDLVWAALGVPFDFSGVAAFLAGLCRARRRRSKFLRMLYVLALLLLVFAFSSCGCPTTRHQNYTVTINAVGTVAGTSVTQNATVTVIVD
jgi:hypothetical protein